MGGEFTSGRPNSAEARASRAFQPSLGFHAVLQKTGALFKALRRDLAPKSQHQAIWYSQHVQPIEPPLKIPHSVGGHNASLVLLFKDFAEGVNQMKFSIIRGLFPLLLLSLAWVDSLRRQHKLWQATVSEGRKEKMGSR